MEHISGDGKKQCFYSVRFVKCNYELTGECNYGKAVANILLGGFGVLIQLPLCLKQPLFHSNDTTPIVFHLTEFIKRHHCVWEEKMV